MPTRQSIVLYGDFSDEHIPIQTIADELGFEIHSTVHLSDLEEIQKQHRICAVLLHADSFASPWPELLSHVRTILTGDAKIIMCHRSELADSRAQMVAAGAFYTLLTPLAKTETRQALGFVWAARRAKVHEMPTKKAARRLSRSAGAA
jgi:hypothetical protein